MNAVDLHQHLWPEPLVELLRRRTRAPYLRGWQLVTEGEPAYEIQPRDHAVGRRFELDRQAGIGLACVSLSAPLGIESLPRDEAGALIDAWHGGARDLPGHFAAWASVPAEEPDLAGLAELLNGPFVGRAAAGDGAGQPGRVARRGRGPARCRARRQAGLHPPGSRGRGGRGAVVVGARRRVRRAAAGRLVGLARVRRTLAFSAPAARLRRRRGPRARPPRATGGARRPARTGRPGRLRRHLVVRRAGPRRAGARPRDRRPRAGQRPALRRAPLVAARRGRDAGSARRQPAPGAGWTPAPRPRDRREP